MASMRESDTGLWLHNKLGSTDELWAPPSIASLLTASVIDNIRLCFHGLSSAVKLKLLLGMLHLPRRAVDEMKGALTEIIQLATLDSDPWVLMVADILKSFPDTGSLNLDLEEQNPNVQDILGELREKVSECETSAMLPLECQYLNKNALTTLAGPLTPPVKHFQLKRKPKSATLRAELLQKSTETAQQLKKTAGVPFHAKGRGLVKKIDTTNTEVVEKQAKEETVVENATPDYAAGLVSTQKLGSLNNEPALPSTSYLPATPSVVPSSSYIPSSETQPAGSAREALQTNRQTEEPAAPNATTTLPAQFKQRTPMYNSNSNPPAATPTSPLTPTTPPAISPAAQAPQVAPQTQQQPPPKKSLSLTREQMYAAQEMFKTANKVTRPEKALILGFMAGSRENPCQEQGDIIQIKLSEHTEDLPKADGTGSTTMLVDTVFEMNYATGKNECLALSSALEPDHGVFNRHLELLMLCRGLVHRPQCLQLLPTRPLPAPEWATLLPALPAGILHQATLAPSKTQLFAFLACQDHFASTFKGPNDSRCKVCRTGEYQLQRGKESCDLCPENHYCPSPDVNPVRCPPDAFCPRGSTEPTYCMELFLYKAGDSCQLTPVMVVILATFSAGGILVIFLIILRRRKDSGKKSLKSLLLPRGSAQHTTYGGTEHTEPVYAGW
ncbi:Negative elongation factor A [Pitangus sulphuratus]|nr:Negative elongation factor A [Pitangus sulphuratus]